MKILHIGDIHLGCTLDNFSRNDEIKKVFDFIVKTIPEQKIEAALIAGDVFDNGRPSAQSQDLYYNFLLDMQQAGCKQVIVIAGNHDYPDFLDAPKGLLSRMNIHVVGNVNQDDLSQEVFALGDPENPAAFVCAVPNLENKDVASLIPADYAGARVQCLAYGIAEHYKAVWKIADGMRAGREIPIIGMGHLYASGSSFGANRDENRVGNKDGVDLATFAKDFDYMALGHIHKPQHVPGHENWRYAGSILPMEILENNHVREVVLLDTQDLGNSKSLEIPDECFHKMAYISGDMKELRTKLDDLRKTNSDTWVKAVYTGEDAVPNWSIDLKLELRESGVQLLETENKRPVNNASASSNDGLDGSETAEQVSLSKLSPKDVFLKYLDTQMDDCSDVQRVELEKLYQEAQDAVIDPKVQSETTATAVVGLMKFKRLFMKNVNSLYGENIIDFEDPAFRTEIFLIHGPTGAGKSSILDAICLALYAETPRSGNITNMKNPVMSEGAKEIQAELTFSLGSDEYRAAFSQKRTKDGASTPYAAATHVLFKNGKEVSGTKSEVDKEIVNLLGMDLKQFTQCVLLAQGSFDAFLKTDATSRASLLTQITGTEIYNKIGRQINQSYLEIERENNLLAAKLKDITCLSQDEVVKLKADLKQKQDELTANEVKRHACEAIEQLFTDIEKKKAAVTDGQNALDAAKEIQNSAAAKQLALENALKAQKCQTEYADFQQKNELVKANKAQEVTLSEDKKNLETVLSTATTEDTAAQEALAAALKAQSDQAVIFQKVRELDTRIGTKEPLERSAQIARDAAKNTKLNAENTFKDAEKAWQEKQNAVQASTTYLADHGADSTLAGKQDAWELRRKKLVSDEKANHDENAAITTAETSLKASKDALAKAAEKKTNTAAELSAVKNAIAKNEKKLADTLAGKTQEELMDLRAAAGKLQDFFKDSDSRSAFLTPGKPCPLCGSTSHPYCDGSAVPEAHDYSQDMQELDERLSTIASCEKALNADRPKLARLDTELKNLEREYSAQESDIRGAEESLQKRRAKLSETQEQTARDAQALAAEFMNALQVQWTDHTRLPQELQKRIEAYNAAKANAASLQETQQVFNAAQAAYDAVAKQNADDLQAKEDALKVLTNELKALKEKRAELFGAKVVEDEETKLSSKTNAIRETALLKQTAKTTAATNVENNRLALEQNATEQTRLNELLNASKDALEKKLVSCGFKDIQDLCDKRMEADAQQTIQQELDKINAAVTTAAATLVERENALATEKAKLAEGTDRQQNLTDLETLNIQKQELQGGYDEINNKLAIDQKQNKDSQETLEKRAKLEVQFNHWKLLDNMLGTANGDRFAKIAQGYTFRELLHCANNNRLTSLQSHFTLVSDKNNPLELNVIDHYRNNQIRTAKNLSGGESFEVSLALALGLADMSSISQKARLGNVLLDEGFGTLDDKSLDSAINLLKELNNSGTKLVGIISHVEKLHNWIDTQIQVSSNCGMGTLSGAGVKSLADTRALWDADHPQEAEKRKQNEEKAAEEAAKEAAREERKAARIAREAAKEERKAARLAKKAAKAQQGE